MVNFDVLWLICFIDANRGNADSSGEEDSDDEDENTNKSQSETHDLVSYFDLVILDFLLKSRF